MSEKPIAAGKSSFDLVDPKKVFAELRLQSDSVLLDVACGVGNYAVAACEVIDESGAVHAVDLWREGIAALTQRADELGLSQIRPALADAGKHLPLEDGSVDVALLATVLHDLVQTGADQGALAEIARVLRPGGRLVVIEFDKLESEPGPPLAIRLSPGQVEDLVTPQGFREEHIVPCGPHNYLVSFFAD